MRYYASQAVKSRWGRVTQCSDEGGDFKTLLNFLRVDIARYIVFQLSLTGNGSNTSLHALVK